MLCLSFCCFGMYPLNFVVQSTHSVIMDMDHEIFLVLLLRQQYFLFWSCFLACANTGRTYFIILYQFIKTGEGVAFASQSEKKHGDDYNERVG